MILKSTYLKKFIKPDFLNNQQDDIKQKYELESHLYDKQKFLDENDIKTKIPDQNFSIFINSVMNNQNHNELMYQSNSKLQIKSNNNFNRIYNKGKNKESLNVQTIDSTDGTLSNTLFLEKNKKKVKVKTAEDIFKKNKIKETSKYLKANISIYNEEMNNKRLDLNKKVISDRNQFRKKKLIDDQIKKEEIVKKEKRKEEKFGYLIPKIIKNPVILNDVTLDKNDNFSKLYHNKTFLNNEEEIEKKAPQVLNFFVENANTFLNIKENEPLENRRSASSIKNIKSRSSYNNLIKDLTKSSMININSNKNDFNSTDRSKNDKVKSVSFDFKKIKIKDLELSSKKENINYIISAQNKKMISYKPPVLFPENKGREFKSIFKDDQIYYNHRCLSAGPNKLYKDSVSHESYKYCDNILKTFKTSNFNLNTYHNYDWRNYKDENENNILHHAALCGRTDLVKLLLEKGFDPNKKNKFGDTPCHLAASKEKIDTLGLLLKSNGSLYTKNDKGEVPASYLKEVTLYYLNLSISKESELNNN